MKSDGLLADEKLEAVVEGGEVGGTDDELAAGF